ncbi:hypothetical protein [Acinetobacter baumannii]|uniref:hypothetical protein n=1 Tax=Acinetobacter baumannii TaxID=470 RepID=UPI00366F1A2B
MENLIQDKVESKFKQRVILLNGPPNTGKDVSAEMLKELFGGGSHKAFKDVLYEETAKYFNVGLDWMRSMATDRTTKEAPTRKLFDKDLNWIVRLALTLLSFIRPVGFSPRQALIHVSENIIKPRFGDTYFGHKLLEAIKASGDEFTFVSDSGFIKEIHPLVEAGLEVYVLRLKREGCTYAGDSRRYLTDKELKELGVHVIDIDNNGTLDELKAKLLDASLEILLGVK